MTQLPFFERVVIGCGIPHQHRDVGIQMILAAEELELRLANHLTVDNSQRRLGADVLLVASSRSIVEPKEYLPLSSLSSCLIHYYLSYLITKSLASIALPNLESSSDPELETTAQDLNDLLLSNESGHNR